MPNSNLKCRNCGKRKPRDEVIRVPLGAFCDYNCASAYGQRKASNDRFKALRKKIVERKAKLYANDLTHQKKLTQNTLNMMIRELDKDQPCISCGKPAGTYVLNAGHFKTVGAYPELRFDPRNIYAQCAGCNSGQQKFKKGDNAVTIQKFRAAIAQRFGIAMVDYLEGPHEPKHYTCADLKELRKTFADEARRLKSGEPPSRDWRAL